MRWTQLVVFAMVVAVAAPALAATDLDKALKNAAKFAVQLNDSPTKSKGLCVCLETSSSVLENALGRITYIRAGAMGGSEKIQIGCEVFNFGSSGNLGGLIPCDDWMPLTP